MQILGVVDTDKRVFNVLNRALEDEFRLQVLPGNFEHDETLQFVDMIIYDLKGGKAGFAELKRLRQVEPTIPQE